MAYLKRGDLRLLNKDVAGALADYDRAIDLAPNEPLVRVARGEARQQQGQFEDAAADFSKAIELKPHMAEAFRGRGMARLQMGKKDDGRMDFVEAALLRPGWTADLEAQLKQFGAESIAAVKAIPLSPAQIRFNNGMIMLSLGHEDSAKMFFTQAVVLDPSFKPKVDEALRNYQESKR